MAGKALGVLEVKSVGVLVRAADIMAKTADIEVVSYEKIGSANVAAFIRGEVPACEAAIRAALEFVNQTAAGLLVTAYVLPEPHIKLGTVFPLK